MSIMMKRRASSRSPSDSSSASLPQSKRGRPAPSAVLHGRKLFILQTKIEEHTLAGLYALVEQSSAALVSRCDDADVVITAIGMRKRLERHIDWDVARRKAVVKPSWLEDSVAQGRALPCEDYAALQELQQSTAANCPTDDSDSDEIPPSGTTYILPESSSHPPPAYLLPPSSPLTFDKTAINPFARFACARASPLICVNQSLCETLDVIQQSRLLEGEERSALSYQRAIAAVKSFPYPISRESREDVRRLPYLGTKLQKMIDEYLNTGHIGEIETIRSSERFKSLSAFSSIYGIGPTTARHLYALGLRTFRELEVYYEVDDAPDSLTTVVGKVHKVELAGETSVQHKPESEHDVADTWIKIALSLRHDLALKIPRALVERIYRVIAAELDSIQPGCVSTIVGGYRRGKSECGDIDIVFTHPVAETSHGLCDKLVGRLRAKGLVTHVIRSAGFHAYNPLRAHNWDSLEKALTVFVPPGMPTRRRVDLIFAPPEAYWTAIVGWTGSTMFERDLRSVAKQRGLKFDSAGITRRRDLKLFYPQSEKEVFDLFGLPWIEPVWRNADC